MVYLQKTGKTVQWKTSVHQYVSPWSSQGNRTLDDLLFYLFDLSVLGQRLFCRGHCTYLHLALLCRAILANVPLLSAYEASPLAHHLSSVYVHWHALSVICRPPPRSRVVALSMGGRLGCRGTCSLVGAGGSNGLLVATGLCVALGNAIDLVIHPFLLSFLIHDEDACLPLGIGSGNIDPSVGDECGVGAWDS